MFFSEIYNFFLFRGFLFHNSYGKIDTDGKRCRPRSKEKRIIMEKFILSCCSTVDLPREHLEKRDIRFICYRYSLDGKEYTDDLGESMPLPAFYEAMTNGATAKTTQISAGFYIDYFTPMLEEGYDILHVCLSSGITGSVNSANTAVRTLSEAYPHRKIYIVDSLGASSGSGLLVDMLADYRDEGHSVTELFDYAERIKKTVQHWFFSTDLTYYVKGGRISKAAGWFGTAFQICPLLNMDAAGHLVPREKVRTKARVIDAIVRKMEENAKDGHDYSGKCFVSHSAAEKDAMEVIKKVEERFPKLKGQVLLCDIGTTIGAHTGPGTVALFFIGAARQD